MEIITTILQIMLVCTVVMLAYIAGEGDGRAQALEEAAEALSADEIDDIIREATDDDAERVMLLAFGTKLHMILRSMH